MEDVLFLLLTKLLGIESSRPAHQNRKVLLGNWARQ